MLRKGNDAARITGQVAGYATHGSLESAPGQNREKKTMKYHAGVLCAVLTLAPFGLTASEPTASAEAQRKFWELTERIAVALPGDARDLEKMMAPTFGPIKPSGAGAQAAGPAEIGPSLFAGDVKIVMGDGNRAASVSFRLSGSCIPFAAVRKRYPQVLVINQSHGGSELEWDTLGVHVGDAIIGFWYQGINFSCTRRVDVTPAGPTLTRITL